MKKITYLLLIILIASCNNDSKRLNEKEFSLNVTLDNLKDSLTVVLASIDWRNRDYNIIDSTYSRDGKFHFKNKISKPSLHTILIKDYKNKVGKQIHFWFENGEIIINGNYDDFENATVIGSQLNEVYKQYLQFNSKDKLDFIYNNPNNYFSLSTIMEQPEWTSKDSLKFSKLIENLY